MKTKLLNNGIMVLDADSHISKWVEETGKLDHDEGIKKICSLIKPGDVVIDVGANIGSHTTAYLKAVGDGLVYAIEPNKDPLACLIHNCPRAVIISGAAMDFFGLIRLQRSVNVGATCLDSLPGYDAICFPISDVVHASKVALIKFDVEGCERFAIRGASRIISRDHPVMIVEVAPGHLARYGVTTEALLRTIEDLGYKTEPLHAFDPHQYDLLCTPK